MRENCIPGQEKKERGHSHCPVFAQDVRDGRKVSRPGNRFSVSTRKGHARDSREKNPIKED